MVGESLVPQSSKFPVRSRSLSLLDPRLNGHHTVNQLTEVKGLGDKGRFTLISTSGVSNDALRSSTGTYLLHVRYRT